MYVYICIDSIHITIHENMHTSLSLYIRIYVYYSFHAVTLDLMNVLFVRTLHIPQGMFLLQQAMLVLQCGRDMKTLGPSVAVCCNVLQCVAMCCSVFVVVCCSVLQCVAVCCSVLQCVAVCCSAVVSNDAGSVCCSVLQFVAGCCNVFVAVSCSMLQCVAVCCSVLQCVVLYRSAGAT